MTMAKRWGERGGPFVATLLAVLMVLAEIGNGQAATERRIALVIGNSAYPAGALKNPANDAALMTDTLRRLDFDVISAFDADQRAMKRAIQKFGERLETAGRDAVGLFYYAGHGVQAGGVNYLIPIAAEVNRETDLEIEAVSANWVLGQMEFAGNRLNIVVLDACRNNPFTRSFRSRRNGLARMDAPSGTLIAYSTSPGNVAADGDGANSPYTSALVQAMARPGLKIEEAFKQVRVSVMGATGDRQVPWEASSLTGDFRFVPGSAPAKTAMAPAASPGAGAGQATIEIAFWKSIENSENPADFDAYVAKYGQGGAFTVLARNRARTLRAGQGSGGDSRSAARMSDEQLAAEALIKGRQMLSELAESAGGLMGAREVPFGERVKKFRGLLGHVVDFGPMAKFVLGKHRQTASQEQWDTFFFVYKELFLAGYEFSSFNSWSGKFEVKTIRAYGRDVLITIEARRPGKDPLEFALRVRRRPGSFFGFKIIDAMLKGISLLVTQRDEFAPVLARDGVDGLIATLEKKIGKVEQLVEILD